jgi:soluble lytic murein transglycosylase-like protein
LSCGFDDLGGAFGRARTIIRGYQPSGGSGGDDGGSGGSERDTEEDRREREREAARERERQRERERRAEERRLRREAAERERKRIADNLIFLNTRLIGARSTPRVTPADTTTRRSPASVAAAHRDLEQLLTAAPQNFHIEAEPFGLQGTVAPGQAADALEQARIAQQAAKAAQIRDAIVQGTNLRIVVRSSSAQAYPNPRYQRTDYELVRRTDYWIAEESAKVGVDPDLVRAIIWMESTHGWYDRVLPESQRKTILPMNVYASYWKDLGFSRAELNRADTNIRAGAVILKGLWTRVENPSVEKVATLYHDLRDEAVSGYGKTVDYYYQTKPWKQKQRK